MSVDYSGVLVVGLPIDEMERIDEDGNWDEDGVLEHIPNYYDSCNGIVGIVVKSSGTYSFREIDCDITAAIETAKSEFKRLTGQEGKTYISCRGY